MDKVPVLVTGATGLIGFHVASRLADDSSLHPICIVRNSHYSDKIEFLKKRGITFLEGSFFDPEVLTSVFVRYPVQHVIHLAALRGGGSGSGEDYDKVNVQGTKRLLQESLIRGVSRFVFCSSVGVYGTIPTEVPAKVETSLNGDNLYHQSKIAAERMVHDYAEKGLGTVIIRPTVTYASGDTGFPGTLVRMVRAHRLLLSPSDVRIHLLDASALAELIYLIVCKDRLKSNVFIAADKRPVLLKDLVDQIHNHFYHTPYPSYLKMPRVFFDAIALVFRVFKSEKWLVRIQLISKSWYYDINETLKSGIDFRPAKTETSFIQKMCERSEN